METISVAVIKETKNFPGVQLQEVNVTDYTGVEGFTFFTDCNNYPTATPCILIHLPNDDLVSCPIDKVAFIAINKDSDETAERSEAIEQCKSFCMDEIKEHKLDPFKTEVFYIICGYAPYLTITEVCRIVNDLREYVINQ